MKLFKITSFRQQLEKIPCASILVRSYKAPAENIKVLSI